MRADPPRPSPDCTVAGLTFLSGSNRGNTVYLALDAIRIGTADDAHIRIPADTEPLPAPVHATLFRAEDGYEVQATPGESVWVGGELVAHRRLQGGEILEVGRDGAVLKYRAYPPGHPLRKSLPDVFSDCADVAALAGKNPIKRALTFVAAVQDELDRSLSTPFKLAVLGLIGLLAVSTALLAFQSSRLQNRLSRELARVDGLEEMLEETRSPVTAEEIALLRDQLAQDLEVQQARLEALELRADAGARVAQEAGKATVFIQASYIFRDPETDRPLRFLLGPDGQPIRSPFGPPPFTVDGDGPLLEPMVTGTGFIVGSDGLLVTNRHVAAPWEVDEVATRMAQRGFRPELNRFIAYLPDWASPVELEIAALSENEDVAVLIPSELPDSFPFLTLTPTPPPVGSEVVVMGYPLGIRALLARTDLSTVERLVGEEPADFWDVARQLAEAGDIKPLATRGIVGQVTATTVVYDALTTSGGSGGPVLNTDGEVVAVNMAVLPEFGGSNLGVPASAALALIEVAAGN